MLSEIPNQKSNNNKINGVFRVDLTVPNILFFFCMKDITHSNFYTSLLK